MLEKSVELVKILKENFLTTPITVSLLENRFNDGFSLRKIIFNSVFRLLGFASEYFTNPLGKATFAILRDFFGLLSGPRLIFNKVKATEQVEMLEQIIKQLNDCKN
jgi:hypothetical protein